MSVEIVMLCAAGVILSPGIAWEIIKRWPRSPEKQADFLQMVFILKRRAQGLPMDKVFSEMKRFETLAKIRRIASDLVYNDASTTEEAIRDVAKQELLIMAKIGYEADARAMAKALPSLRLDDLLDPVAYKLWGDYRMALLPALRQKRSDEDIADTINAYSGRI